MLLLFTLLILCQRILFFFFFNDTATTEIYTLSLHDALPILTGTPRNWQKFCAICPGFVASEGLGGRLFKSRSEEHTSELQSLAYLVCRLLLEKKKKIKNNTYTSDTHSHSQLFSTDTSAYPLA